MLPFLIVSVLLFYSTYALQCIGTCSIANPFNKTFSILDGQCQQPAFVSVCALQMTFYYSKQQYEVVFDNIPITHDYIYITTDPYFSYQISYTCPKDTNCAIFMLKVE